MRPAKCLAVGAVCLSVSLCGCTSVAPVWPMSEPAAEFPHYPTVTSTPSPLVCVDGAPPVTANSPDNLLFCAQQEIVRTGDAYASEKRTIEAVKNGEILVLFGLGTAAGVNVAEKGSKGPLLTLGLAATSLLGLSTALGVDGQQQIYGAGVAATECLKNVDAALDDVKKAQTKSQLMYPEVFASLEGVDDRTAKSISVDGGRRIFAPRNARDIEALDATPATQLPSVLKPHLTALKQSRDALQASVAAIPAREARINSVQQATLASSMSQTFDALAFIQDAATSEDALRDAVNAATDPTQRARNLTKGLNGIKQAVADSLYKNVDLSKIFDATKAGLQKVAGTAAAIAPTVTSAANKAQPKAPTLRTLTAPTLDKATVANANQQLAQLAAIQLTTDATQKLTDTYDTCVGMAVPKPPKP